MKKLKIKINYHELQELIFMVEDILATYIATDKKQLETNEKIAIDQYLGLRHLLKKKALAKETAFKTIDKFKIELRYTEAVYLLQLINYATMPKVYTQLDTSTKGVGYLIENL